MWDSCVFVLKRIFVWTKFLSGKLIGYAESGHLHYDLMTLCKEHLLTFFQFQAPDIRHCEVIHVTLIQILVKVITIRCWRLYIYLSKFIQILIKGCTNTCPVVAEDKFRRQFSCHAEAYIILTNILNLVENRKTWEVVCWRHNAVVGWARACKIRFHVCREQYWWTIAFAAR